MTGIEPVTALWLAIVVPLVGAVGVALTGRWPNLREAVTLVTGVVLLCIVASLWPVVMAGEVPRLVLVETLPGIPIALSVEPLGMLFALIGSLLWIVTSVYAIGYMRGHHEKNQTRFYTCFAIAIACTMGVAFSDNMFTLFLFYEALTVSTYPLVTHAGTDAAKKGGRVYLGILISTSIVFQLLAIIWTYSVTGNLDFQQGGVFSGDTPAWLIAVLYALFAFGIGKAALMPFHRWLPAAMVAPTPVSALLHAVAVVKAGVFTVLKVTVYLFGLDTITGAGANEWLLYVAGATILLASLVAMTKDNLKARLAYSTVSQLGYIVLGALLVTQLGIIGGAMHIATHAFGKITLFFAAGAIMVAAHKTEVSQLDGLGKRMPWTFAAFTIGALSIIGLPPLAGMWSKWFLALATIETHHWVLLGILMVSSLLNIFYLLSIPMRAYFRTAPAGGHDDDHHGGGEAPLACLLAMAFTSLGCIVLFFFPGPLYELAAMIVPGVTP
ncbi:monovalent cation/H+ antiporter subunit D family protein [Marinihelvus fidelis]|uniref:Monovalent cation/H+ antiporter subunit D family protein n=1 Tax=Marinihelvus fidelis TaxID=2613842 RepID=A0A5N0T5D3_9GAMM|nr:monovalent cation/H+ antiporter subunit D family protein [Marinihelvus fidelis]KAA9130290.1 monovalent cation/H+ antiporter subunit D family protein [Marinihelvus fidelis]